MALEVINTANPSAKPSVVMLVYGEGGVGKTTFTSTAPKPILADCEGGSKYFGLRSISMDVVLIKNWSDMKDFITIAKEGYDTIVIDPIGELMEKLMQYMVRIGDTKLVQKDGNPTMAGWGWLKKTMRDLIKAMRDSGKHVIIVAHITEKADEQRVLKRPMVASKIAEELVNIVDVVGYMTIVSSEGESKRVIIIDPESDKFVAKDRTGQLGRYIEPDFSKIVDACQGNKKFKWSKNQEQTKPKEEVKEAETNLAAQAKQEENEAIKQEAMSEAQNKLNNL